MHIFRSLLIFVVFFILKNNQLWGQERQLFFDGQGRFKIIQFTDVHWGDKLSPEIPWEDTKKADPSKTIQLIKTLIEEEKPNLVVLTGDIVTSPPVEKGWHTIGKIFEEEKQPWTVALGNHDGSDAGLTRNQVFDILIGLPYFIGRKGEVESSVGNFEIPIWDNQQTEILSLVYVLNSNNRPEDEKYGSWDWIHYDQIDWYRKIRDNYELANGGQAIKSLMFFHIPLPEFSLMEEDPSTFLGVKSGSSPTKAINSGLFGSFLEKKEMMGVFVGHHHDNDNIGIYHGVTLGFGRVTGAEAHSSLTRGARIIELIENEFKFNTQIKTLEDEEALFYFPSGISSDDEEKLTFLPAMDVKEQNIKKGIRYTYFEGGRFKNVKDILKNGEIKKKGVIDNFNLGPAMEKDSIAFIFEGFIDVPKKGVYRFFTNSDDGSTLFIDNQLVVDNDGSHYTKREDGKVALEKGFHAIKVEYFQDYLGKKLEVGWSSRFIAEELLPDNVLFRMEPAQK